jgi:hypothetical protein
MTRSEMPESNRRELQALYREAATDEPGPMLDRSILDAARAELKSAAASKARPVPWWKGWLPATTAIAAVVVGVSLTWRVMDEQERQLREEMRAAPAAGEITRQPAADNAAVAAPASAAKTAPTAGNAPVAPRKEASGATPAVASPPAGPEPRPFVAPAVPAAAAPMPLEVETRKASRAEARDEGTRRDAVVQDAAPAVSRAVGKLEAGRPGASSETDVSTSSPPAAKAAAAPEAASAEAWLRRIRELRAAGRDAEAAQSLARFRQRYPDFPLPADMK